MKTLILLAVILAVLAGICWAQNAEAVKIQQQFDWLFNPVMSLVWGCLGIAFWLWTKPNSQKLSAVCQWMKDNARDTIGAFIAWFIVWIIWMGILQYTGTSGWLLVLKDIMPDKIGPFAAIISVGSTSLINHAIESWDSYMSKKGLTP